MELFDDVPGRLADGGEGVRGVTIVVQRGIRHIAALRANGGGAGGLDRAGQLAPGPRGARLDVGEEGDLSGAPHGRGKDERRAEFHVGGGGGMGEGGLYEELGLSGLTAGVAVEQVVDEGVHEDPHLQVTLAKIVVSFVAPHAPVLTLVRDPFFSAAPAAAPRGGRVLREERVMEELEKELGEFFFCCLETK